MWLIIAVIAMLCWSGSDFFSKVGSKPEDKYSHWKMVMVVGLVMGIHACIEIAGGTKITLQDIIYYLPASFMYILSMIFGYASLRYIELSISSPICNSSGALAFLLCVLFKIFPVDDITLTVFTFFTTFILYGGLMNLFALFSSAGIPGNPDARSFAAGKVLYIYAQEKTSE